MSSRAPLAGLIGAGAMLLALFIMVAWAHALLARTLPWYAALLLVLSAVTMAVFLPFAGTLSSAGDDAGAAVSGEAMRDLCLATGVSALVAGLDHFVPWPHDILWLAWGGALAAAGRGVIGFVAGECFQMRQAATQERADDARYGWSDRAKIERARADRAAERKNGARGWGADLY